MRCSSQTGTGIDDCLQLVIIAMHPDERMYAIEGTLQRQIIGGGNGFSRLAPDACGRNACATVAIAGAGGTGGVGIVCGSSIAAKYRK